MIQRVDWEDFYITTTGCGCCSRSMPFDEKSWRYDDWEPNLVTIAELDGHIAEMEAVLEEVKSVRDILAKRRQG